MVDDQIQIPVELCKRDPDLMVMRRKYRKKCSSLQKRHLDLSEITIQ